MRLVRSVGGGVLIPDNTTGTSVSISTASPLEEDITSAILSKVAPGGVTNVNFSSIPSPETETMSVNVSTAVPLEEEATSENISTVPASEEKTPVTPDRITGTTNDTRRDEQAFEELDLFGMGE